MTKVYIVFGSSGDYDDYSTWPVRAFADKDKAESFRILCIAEAERVKQILDRLEIDQTKRKNALNLTRDEYSDNLKFYKVQDALMKKFAIELAELGHRYDIVEVYDRNSLTYTVVECDLE